MGQCVGCRRLGHEYFGVRAEQLGTVLAEPANKTVLQPPSGPIDADAFRALELLCQMKYVRLPEAVAEDLQGGLHRREHRRIAMPALESFRSFALSPPRKNPRRFRQCNDRERAVRARRSPDSAPHSGLFDRVPFIEHHGQPDILSRRSVPFRYWKIIPDVDRREGDPKLTDLLR